MTASRVLRACAAAALLAAPQAGWSVFDPVNDDTDIFLANPSFAAERPNILIILDNTANWNTPFTAEKTALVNVVSSLTSDFNVGLMMFTETGSGNTGNDGGYVKFGVRQMTDANKTVLAGIVGGLDNTADKSNGGKGSLAMYEAFQYFGGTTAYAGATKIKRDYAGNASNPAAALAGNPLSDASDTGYTSPITDSCQKNFIIYISNGPAQDNTNDLGVSEAALKVLNNNVTPSTISLNPSGSEGNWMDEWARYMSVGDCNFNVAGTQNVFTYTVDIGPASAAGGQGPGWTALMQSAATNGKGKYFAVANNAVDTGSQIEAALKAIFSEVQAVNSVFASTTLPVSVNVRGTNLNQVYIGVFRPDSQKSPRWLGNLKLYKLGVNTATVPATLFLADAAGNAAEDSSNGFISVNAKSYWTAASTYWSFRDPSVNGTGGSSDSPDGNLVEKGGAAQYVRTAFPASQASRNLYTCTAASGAVCAAGSSLSSTLFNTSNANMTAADLAAYTTYDVTSISSSGTTGSVTLGATPSPAFADGNTVRIAGASPNVFNGDFVISSTAGSGATFNITLAAALASNVALVTTSAAHNVSTGDSIQTTGASPTAYNTTSGSDVPATRLGAQTFSYNLPSSASANASPRPTLKAKKSAASVSGSSVNTTATVSIPAHGYTPVGGSLANFSITGACAGGFNVSSVTATIVNVDTLQVPVALAAIPGTTCGSASGVQTAITALTTTVHELQVGDLVTITGLLPVEYNVTNVAITAVPTSQNFTYIPTSVPATVATGTATITAKRVFTLANNGSAGSGGGINNGSTNGTRNNGTGKTATAHNVSTGNWTLTVSGATGTTNFNVSGVAFTNPTSSATGFAYSMAGNEAVNSLATGSPLTATFNRSSFTRAAGVLGANFPEVVVDSTAGIQAVLTLTSATTPSISSVSVQASATGSITAGRTSDTNATLRDQIIAWVRGADNAENEDPNTNAPTVSTVPAGSDIRPSVHGDVLHSRPAVVNYNRYGDDNDIYAFYGGNDGVFRALKGGTAAHTTGADVAILPGTERWGFIAREFFPKLKRLRSQTPTISNLNQKDYFADGSIGIYLKDAKGNGNTVTPLTCAPGSCSGADTVSGVIGDNTHATLGDKVYLYMTMRRGGDFMYALDVTNPAAPKLLWRKGPADTGWEQLGQTWSEPKVSRSAASLGNSNNPDNVVLIFGAGYDDTVEDINFCLADSVSNTAIVQKAIGAGTVTFTSAGSCTLSGATGSATTFSRTKGRGVLVVDAFNGNVVWQASAAVTTSSTGVIAPAQRKLNVPDMTCAVPSDTTVLDKNRDGFADRIYVGDTCGQMWRLDISNADMDEWTATKIAAISSSTATDVANQRKFLFPPDLVFGTDGTGNYTAVLLGSGDREHPFSAVVTNRFYMFKDRDSGVAGSQAGAINLSSVKISGFSPALTNPPTPAPLTDADVFDATSAVLTDGTDPLGLAGWKIALGSGEKVVSSATSVAGTVFFNTNQPSSAAGGGACGSNLGIAREYLVGFADAAATIDLNATGGITIADRSTIHAGGGYLPSPVPVVVEIDGQKYQAVISGTAVQSPPGLTLEKRSRAFWYKQID